MNASTIAGCENGFLFVDGGNPMFAPKLRPKLGPQHASCQGLKRFGQLFRATFEDANRQKVRTNGPLSQRLVNTAMHHSTDGQTTDVQLVALSANCV